MPKLTEFLDLLFEDGRVVLTDPPRSMESDRATAMTRRELAFAIHRLDVAGPILAFDELSAYQAAKLVYLASWLLVNPSEAEASLNQFLTESHLPRSAGSHLSTDLVYQFLPQIERRARWLGTATPLSSCLADLLRAWPL